MASKRIKITGVLTREYSFERPAYGYGTETVTIYKITGEDGKIYVWKTTAALGMEVEVPFETRGAILYDEDKHVAYVWQGVSKGDRFTFTASVKGESEYKGEPQTEIQRVKVTEIIERAAEKAEQKKADKKQEQLDSIKGEDFIWKMPYKQFKDHYADCETVIDSYEEHVDRFGYVVAPPTIEVIIREGRLKVSGVRGKHFAGYRIRFTLDGKQYINPYRAVSELTAIRQAMREVPNATDFECVEIISYQKSYD